MSTSYLIAAGCDRCEPYFVICGPPAEVVAYVNQLVDDGYNLANHLKEDAEDPVIDDEGKEIKRTRMYEKRMYTVPKVKAKVFFPNCSSGYILLYLFTATSGLTNLQEMMEEVKN